MTGPRRRPSGGRDPHEFQRTSFAPTISAPSPNPMSSFPQVLIFLCPAKSSQFFFFFEINHIHTSQCQSANHWGFCDYLRGPPRSGIARALRRARVGMKDPIQGACCNFQVSHVHTKVVHHLCSTARKQVASSGHFLRIFFVFCGFPPRLSAHFLPNSLCPANLHTKIIHVLSYF